MKTHIKQIFILGLFCFTLIVDPLCSLAQDNNLPAGESPPSSSPEIANATPAKATDTQVMEKVDNIAKEGVDLASKALTATKEKVTELFGGEKSALGKWTAQVLSFLINVLNFTLAGWPLWIYLFSFLIIFFTLAIRQVLVRWIFAFFERIAQRTRTQFDDEVISQLHKLQPPMRTAILLTGIYFSVQVFFALHDPEEIHPVLAGGRQLFRGFIYLAFMVNLGWALSRIADMTIHLFTRLTTHREKLLDDTFIPILRRTAKIFIIIVISLQVLTEFELYTVVNSLIAAAGVSGLAIGLAAQDTIKNIFGSIVLLTDRPFKVGDWILAGQTEGIVEAVGLRSTKIRTFGKTLITIPNSQIVDRDIENISRRHVRRIVTNLGVSYQTKPDEMEVLLERIRQLLQNDPDVWEDTILVRFNEFGESALNIFIYYFSKTTIWDTHLAVRERINLALMRIVDELNLEIAYPTRTLYIHSETSQTKNPGEVE